MRPSSRSRQPNTEVHRYLLQIQIILINQIQFQNTQRRVPSTTGPTGQRDNRYSQPSNKGPGKKAPSHINTQPSISDIFARTSAYPQSRNLGTGHPKLFCTACGEYDHMEKGLPL